MGKTRLGMIDNQQTSPKRPKSSQVNTLPKAKSKTPQQAEQGHAQIQQCL
jgi:hypothetical protein